MDKFMFDISCKDEYALLEVLIPKDKTLKVEASAMATMDTNIVMKTKFKGGFKRFLTKESLFINEFTAESAGGEIKIAPGPSGDISHVRLDGNKKFYITSGSYLASSMGVNLDTKFQGMAKSFFSGESFFLIECSGEGDLWFNTYGAIFEVDVKDEYIVDSGHIVAFTESLKYQITKFGGYKSLFFSGEGFVCKFKGEGKVWIQTKQPMAFVWWADSFRKVKRQVDFGDD
jgi:uncharacterized protein (TIGR00266 family)